MSKLLYQGHGSFRLTTDEGTVVYVDPYAGSGYDIPADLILVTHQHFDHNVISKPAKKPGCTIYQNMDALKNGKYQKAVLCGIEVEAVQAYNDHHPVNECVGYILSFDQLQVYFAGDTSKTEEMKQFSKRHLDYAFLPCDGIYNMNVKEASACADLIQAAHSVPVHMSPGNLFDRKIAESFKTKNRLILEPATEITL